MPGTPDLALRSILVIRRDNIGDLVCTTPLLAALRGRFPCAWIGALVNSYNAPVLDRNPALDAIVAYRKLKHLEPGESALGSLGERIRSLWALRSRKLDCVMLATPDFSPRTLRLARWLGPRRIAGFSDGSPAAARIDLPVPIQSVVALHEVERVFKLAEAVGAQGPIPAMTVKPDAAEVAKARAAIGSASPRLIVGMHISARRPAQRWHAERFAALAGTLRRDHGAASLLLWSPGKADHPQHPGDDEKAAEVLARSGDAAAGYRTERLAQLIGALAACDAVICSDGGAMHIAAALGKPTLCFFGDSPVERWRPWGTRHRILQPASRNVADVTVESAAAAFRGLMSGESG